VSTGSGHLPTPAPERRFRAGEELLRSRGDGAQIIHIGGGECGGRRVRGACLAAAKQIMSEDVRAAGVIEAFVVLTQQVHSVVAPVGGGLPRVFRTAELTLFHAASCRFRYSSWTSCGVR
jgi:hypothetical protein